jgi:predicted nucleotidyltransferase
MTSADPKLLCGVERIVALVHPEAEILFGSSARGDGDDASDWDLFVVLPDAAPPGIARPSALRRAAAPARLPIHAVACRRGVFEAKPSDPNSLSHDSTLSSSVGAIMTAASVMISASG